jgi:membrane associated rhomboid family serine protease
VPFVTGALVLLNIVVFFWEAGRPDPDRATAAFATIPYDIVHRIGPAGGPPDPYLTLITAQFLHASSLHLISNMVFLAGFGPAVERLLGHARYLLFYLACGIAGNLAQTLVNPGSHVPSVGASGAIAGVLGAYLILFPTRPLFLGLPAALVILGWAGLQFVHGFGTVAQNALSEQGGGIAYFSHIGGFLCGVIGIELLRKRREVGARGARY